MCTLNSQVYPKSLILANARQLLIGQIDQIQKLLIRTIPLRETPRRIAYQESTQTFGVLTMRRDIQGEDGQVIPMRNSASCLAQNFTCSSPSIVKPAVQVNVANQYELEVYHLLIIDQTTFKVMHAHQFTVNERAISIASAKLGDDPNYYYIAGTSFIHPGEKEPKLGRIIVFHLVDGKLKQVAEKEIKEVPYVLQEFNGKLLSAINTTIRLFEWTPMKNLKDSGMYISVASLYLKSHGKSQDYIQAAFRTITLMILNEELAITSDVDLSYLVSVELVNDGSFICSDIDGNLVSIEYFGTFEYDDTTEESSFDPVGYFHLGDVINVMKRGSLVMNHPSEMSCPILSKPILFGTNSGSIGLIAQIPETFSEFLLELQKNLTSVIKSVGKIDYNYWRSFMNEIKTEPASKFIDGDVIESFLDLNRSQMAECIQGLPMESRGERAVEDIIKTVQELSRIH